MRRHAPEDEVGLEREARAEAAADAQWYAESDAAEAAHAKQQREAMWESVGYRKSLALGVEAKQEAARARFRKGKGKS